eukprot:4046933-Alexandrium_andersonii.AAC.1
MRWQIKYYGGVLDQRQQLVTTGRPPTTPSDVREVRRVGVPLVLAPHHGVGRDLLELEHDGVNHAVLRGPLVAQ